MSLTISLTFLKKTKILIFQNVKSAVFFIIACGILSLWLRKDHAVRVFENSAKENIRCKELWRRLHKELHSFFFSPVLIGVNIWWRIKWEKSVARMGQMWNYILFFGFPDVYNVFLSLASNPDMQNWMRFIMECDYFAEFVLSHRQKVLKYNSQLFNLPYTRTFLYSVHNLSWK